MVQSPHIPKLIALVNPVNSGPNHIVKTTTTIQDHYYYPRLLLLSKTTTSSVSLFDVAKLPTANRPELPASVGYHPDPISLSLFLGQFNQGHIDLLIVYRFIDRRHGLLFVFIDSITMLDYYIF